MEKWIASASRDIESRSRTCSSSSGRVWSRRRSSRVYPSLTLEEVYATILYYLHNKGAVDTYLEQSERIADAWYREYLEKGPYFLRDEAEARIAAGKAVTAGSRE